MFIYNKGRHSVFSLKVHLIFVCKRRGKAFSDNHPAAMQEIFDKVLDDFEAELSGIERGERPRSPFGVVSTSAQRGGDGEQP